MCGMAGWVSFNRDLRSDQMTVDSMTETMSCRRATGQRTHCGAAHRRDARAGALLHRRMPSSGRLS